jgi:hypothetical protein
MSDDDSETVSREASPCSESPRPVSVGSESPNENICTLSHQLNANIANKNINNNNNTMSSMSKIGVSVHMNMSKAAAQKVGVSIFFS